MTRPVRLSEFDRLADAAPVDAEALYEWRVARAPVGNVRPDDFEWRATDIPEPGEGEVLLRTLYLSLAPVMRMYMTGAPAAGEAPLRRGDVIHGRGVAQVIRSRHPDYREGQVVQGQIGWRTHKVSAMTPQEKMRPMPPNGLPARYGLGALGMTGLSAWAGFFTCGEPKPEDRVVVSGAAGGVGSLVTQLAANVVGCDVVGIAGGAEKCAFVRSNGCRAALDYKAGDLARQLADACPEGLDLYFDNVGGETLDACLDRLRPRARVVMCGSISEYARETPCALPNYTRLRATDSRLQGFFVYNHLSDWTRAIEEMTAWIKDGRLTPVEQITEGFQNMPRALADLYAGGNVGKQICRVGGEPSEWI